MIVEIHFEGFVKLMPDSELPSTTVKICDKGLRNVLKLQPICLRARN